MDFQTNSFFKNKAYVRNIKCMSNIEGSLILTNIIVYLYNFNQYNAM